MKAVIFINTVAMLSLIIIICDKAKRGKAIKMSVGSKVPVLKFF